MLQGCWEECQSDAECWDWTRHNIKARHFFSFLSPLRLSYIIGNLLADSGSFSLWNARNLPRMYARKRSVLLTVFILKETFGDSFSSYCSLRVSNKFLAKVLLLVQNLIWLISVCRIRNVGKGFMSSPFFLFDQLLYSHGVFAAFIALLAMETENPNAANIAMRKLAVR